MKNTPLSVTRIKIKDPLPLPNATQLLVRDAITQEVGTIEKSSLVRGDITDLFRPYSDDELGDIYSSVDHSTILVKGDIVARPTTDIGDFGGNVNAVNDVSSGRNVHAGNALIVAKDQAYKPSTNTWTIASDERLKENINPYTKGLDAILAIRPVTYDYNGKGGFSKIKGNVGVIAQEIKDVIPEGIAKFSAKLNKEDEAETELYNFNSHALTYVLINAIKELNAEIQLLKNK